MGDSAFRGAGRRYDRLIDLYSRRGVFGRVGTIVELERWLAEAGLGVLRLKDREPSRTFSAQRDTPKASPRGGQPVPVRWRLGCVVRSRRDHQEGSVYLVSTLSPSASR